MIACIYSLYVGYFSVVPSVCYHIVCIQIPSLPFLEESVCHLVQCFGDFFGVSIRGTELLALETFTALSQNIGAGIKTEKNDSGDCVKFLGLNFRCAGGDLTVELPPEKKDEYVEIIESILSEGKMSPAQASSVAGKLSFGATWIWGRPAKTYLSPLYQHASQEGSTLNNRTRTALLW